MLGSEYLVAPVMYPGVSERQVWLPAGEWEDIHTKEKLAGGVVITAKAPLDVIPVYRRV